MDKNRFQLVNLPAGGAYRLVPEDAVDAMFGSSQEATIRLPVSGTVTFGYLVFVFRNSRRMTQEQLAEALGIKKRQIISIEGDEALTRKRTLRRMCEFFGSEFKYHVEEFTGLTDENLEE